MLEDFLEQDGKEHYKRHPKGLVTVSVIYVVLIVLFFIFIYRAIKAL